MIVHRYNQKLSPNGWGYDLGVGAVVLMGSTSAVLGGVSPDTTDEEIIKAFAYAFDHTRYAVTTIWVTRAVQIQGAPQNYTEDITTQIKVAWDHPEMVAFREQQSLAQGARAALCTEADIEYLDQLATLLSLAEEESFVLASSQRSDHPMFYAQHLRKRMDALLANHADSVDVRALHGEFHDAYQAFLNASNETAFGTTHAKVTA